MINQKFKWIPAGGCGIDWRGSGGYALTLQQATERATKFLQAQALRGRDIRMSATSCVISQRRPGTEGKGSQWRDVRRVMPDGTFTAMAQGYNPLLEQQRLELVRSVSQTVFDNKESFREEHIGADLAYLIIAIVDRNWEHVDWTVEGYGGECKLLELLEATTPAVNPVWLFIIKDHEAKA